MKRKLKRIAEETVVAYEYCCEDCEVYEYEVGVIPNKACPKCGYMMTANEMEG
jgi:hypothetical protein